MGRWGSGTTFPVGAASVAAVVLPTTASSTPSPVFPCTGTAALPTPTPPPPAPSIPPLLFRAAHVFLTETLTPAVLPTATDIFLVLFTVLVAVL